MVKYCPKCGNQLPDHVQFCIYCGIRLTHPVQPEYNIPYKTQNKLITLKGIRQILIFYTILFLYTSILLFTYWAINKYYILALIPGGLLSIFSLLGIYIGVRNIYNGNKEFSLYHEKSTNIAKKLITWGIIIYVIFSFISPYFSRIFLGISIMRTLIMIPFWLALVYLIKGITTDRIRTLLWIAFFSRFLLVLLSNVSYEILSVFYDVRNLEYYFILGIVSIIPSLLYIYCYYNTYNILNIKIFQQRFKNARF